MVHATRGQSGELAAASGKFSDDFDEFLDAGIEMAGQAQVRLVWLSGVDPCPSRLWWTVVPCGQVANKSGEAVSSPHLYTVFAAQRAP